MLAYHSLLSIRRVSLCLDARSRRIVPAPPVIEHFRDVSDAVSSLGHAEEKVPVLSAVSGGVEPSDLNGQLLSDDIEMRDIICAKHDFGRPVRLEKRLVAAAAVFAYQIPVRVYEINRAVF